MASDGKRGARPIGALVEEILGGVTVQRDRALSALTAAWEGAVGTELAARTRVAGLQRGTLHIVVEGAPLLQHLAHFRKADLLRTLKNDPAAAAVRDLNFTPGT